ncbi:hypothetical protein [Bacillus sp. FJAT-29814]|uniref:hypothetical protein n=1 Tax=Bacillus sp. FJAT-29814 TaxID=1729688 RepID=UPI000B23D5EF|nr:hypothetical protein [Bacillus sp. FJAT-29814]
MEKAMLAAHGVCYKVYSRNHNVRLQVEKRREQDYAASQIMIADLGRRFHT